MGFLGRINRMYILIAAAVLVVGMVVAFVMLVFQPRTNEINTTREARNKGFDEAGKMPLQLIGLAQAQAEFEANKSRFEGQMAKQPKISTDRYQAMFDLWKEYGVNFGPAVTGFVRSTGNEPLGIMVPNPPQQPLDPTPYLMVQAGGFGIKSKSFPAVLKFMRVLAQCPRLAVITGGVTISGQTPDLTALFPVTFYVITEFARPAPGQAMAVGPAPTAPTSGPTLKGLKIW